MRPLIPTMMALALITSCNKHTDMPAITYDDDPLFNESFGKLIDEHPGGPVIWGNNSQFFIYSTANGVIKTDINTLTDETLISKATNASPTQITPDNGSVIFFGTIDNKPGYYTMDLATKIISPLLSLRKDQSAAVYAGRRDMFYYIGDVVEEGRPCEGWDDFFCGVYSTTVNLKLRHKDFATSKEVELNPDVTFSNYSPDGSTAIFRSYTDSAFVFNTALQTWQDSMPLYPSSIYNSFHWLNNSIQYLSLQFGSQEIIIYDLLTHAEAKRIQTSMQITGIIGWSGNAEKIFYTGACTTPGCTYSINEFDLNTMTEKQIVSTASTQLQTSPFEATVSPDGNFIVFTDGYKKFFKEIN